MTKIICDICQKELIDYYALTIERKTIKTLPNGYFCPKDRVLSQDICEDCFKWVKNIIQAEKNYNNYKLQKAEKVKVGTQTYEIREVGEDKMCEIKFRARISDNTIIPFNLQDLVDPKPLFSIRELVIPWLRAGNKPDKFTGLKDKNGKEQFEKDSIRYNGILYIIEWRDKFAKFVYRPIKKEIGQPKEIDAYSWVEGMGYKDVEII